MSMSAEEIQSLNPGDRVSWGPQNPCNGWVIVSNNCGLLCGWDNGELTSWSWADYPLMVRIGEHLTLLRKGQHA